MKTKLAPLLIDKDTVVYIEITEDVEATDGATVSSIIKVEEEEEEELANQKGLKEDFQNQGNRTLFECSYHEIRPPSSFNLFQCLCRPVG